MHSWADLTSSHTLIKWSNSCFFSGQTRIFTGCWNILKYFWQWHKTTHKLWTCTAMIPNTSRMYWADCCTSRQWRKDTDVQQQGLKLRNKRNSCGPELCWKNNWYGCVPDLMSTFLWDRLSVINIDVRWSELSKHVQCSWCWCKSIHENNPPSLKPQPLLALLTH